MAMMKSSLSSPILVTGATGTVGRAVLHALAARGVRATAAVRDPARVPVESASAVRFDYSDPSTFGPALAGQDRVFLIGPPLLASMDELLRPFIEHLASDVPRRVVYLSAYGMDALTELPIHAVNERRLRAAKGLELTVLRPGFFTQNFATYSRADIEERGTLFLPVGKGCTPFVDVVDIARCAAAALLGDGHGGKTYTLTGPEAWSHDEVAACLTRLLGRPITHVAPTPEVFRATLLGAGAPAAIADYSLPVYHLIASGVVATPTDDVRQLTGQAPRAPAEVLAELFVART
jgi:uncharacterized protein YbjT (DUF2867 family)